MWDVWKIHYMTYAEIQEFGDKKRERVAHGLTFEKAKLLVEKLGFGYSMHPESKE